MYPCIHVCINNQNLINFTAPCQRYYWGKWIPHIQKKVHGYAWVRQRMWHGRCHSTAHSDWCKFNLCVAKSPVLIFSQCNLCLPWNTYNFKENLWVSFQHMEFQTQFVLHPYPPPPLPHLSPLPQHEHPYICLIFIFICPPHFILKVPIAVLIPTYKVKDIFT